MDKKTYYLVDESGEVINEVVAEVNKRGRVLYAEEGDRLIRKSSQEAYNYRKNNFGEVKIEFVKVNRRYMDRLAWKYPLIMTLVRYINYADHILMYTNGRLLNPTSLSRVTGISLSTCKRHFRELMRLGIIKRTKIGNKYVYVFDPYVANCSKEVSLDTLELFKNSEYREEK